MAFLGKNETDNALRSFNKCVEIGGDSPLALGYLGLVHGLRNERSEIENILTRFARLTDGYIHPYCEALIHIALDDYDRSFTLLNQAFDERDPPLIYLHSLPGLNPYLGRLLFRPPFLQGAQENGHQGLTSKAPEVIRQNSQLLICNAHHRFSGKLTF